MRKLHLHLLTLGPVLNLAEGEGHNAWARKSWRFYLFPLHCQ